MMVNYGVRAIAHYQAMGRARRFRRAAAAAVRKRSARQTTDRAWPLDMSDLARGQALESSPPLDSGWFFVGADGSGWKPPVPLEIAAMPDFVSPFRWR